MVSSGFPIGCDAQIGIRIMCKWILTTTLIIITMMGTMVDSVRKWGESFETATANLKKYSGARILNVLKNLEGCHVRLKFQFKMLGSW